MKRILIAAVLLAGIGSAAAQSPAVETIRAPALAYSAQPFVRDIYFADPSAHLFGGRIYIYGSHDIEGPLADNEPGNRFVMRDYRFLSMDAIGAPVTVHPVALELKNVAWADRQLWAPDAAYKNGHYYLYFPAKDKTGIFRIGVAIGDQPAGPFVPQAEPMRSAYSIDPAVFTDDDGQSYLYFGGIIGGQLQRWKYGHFDPSGPTADSANPDQPAVMPRVAKLGPDMLQLAETPRDAVLLDKKGEPLLAGDHERRFFEAAKLHKYRGVYYFTYSTGDTHFINYATGTSPYGPFTYQGHILLPVSSWTTHQSVLQSNGHWYLFYHDSQLSGRSTLRNSKVSELIYNSDGSIRIIDPFQH
ncbi:MAG: glycoside hydrolase family 43 protein [Rhizomicrobium sp.]|nr:glycoside hydrolase family 43 protein [Rhizomicrobium sp.]